ncbi:MAG: hypothetical protein ACWA5L_10125 [bacterium]
MLYFISFLVLVIAIGGILFLVGKYNTSEPASQTMDEITDSDYSLSKSIVIIGPLVNHKHCSNQRLELKRILPALAEKNIRIVELYGDRPPTKNGKEDHHLDNELLRQSLSAENGFHIILVDDHNRTCLRSIMPLAAEALFHILGLQDLLPDFDDDEDDVAQGVDSEDPQEEIDKSIAFSQNPAPNNDCSAHIGESDNESEIAPLPDLPATASEKAEFIGPPLRRAPSGVAEAIRRRYSAAAE